MEKSGAEREKKQQGGMTEHGRVWRVIPLSHLMVFPIEMGTMSHISNE